MQSKSDLRRTFRARLTDAAAASDPAQASEALSHRLIGFLSRQGGTWAAYLPTGMEADIRLALEKLENIEWAFPRLDGELMAFYAIEPRIDGTGFTLNKWGILEPDPAHARRVRDSEIRGLIVPALAFDRNCNRLGKGGGFYDRYFSTLRQTNETALKIGVALDCQISEDEIPVEPYDVPMDWVVTESRCYRRGIGDSACHPDGLSERKSS